MFHNLMICVLVQNSFKINYIVLDQDLFNSLVSLIVYLIAYDDNICLFVLF